MHQQTAALRLTQYWPRRYTLVLLSFAAVFICYMDRVNISVAIIPMATELGWNSEQQGRVLAAFFVGYHCAITKRSHRHVGARREN